MILFAVFKIFRHSRSNSPDRKEAVPSLKPFLCLRETSDSVTCVNIELLIIELLFESSVSRDPRSGPRFLFFLVRVRS